MASAKSFKTSIEFGGTVLGSFGSAVNNVKRGLTGIERAAQSVKARTQLLGSSIANGFRSATAAIGRFALAGAGIAMGLIGIQSLSDVLGRAKEAFEAAELSSAKLNAALANNPILAKQGTDAIKAQKDAIVEIAKHYGQITAASTGIYKAGFATLATYGAGAKEIQVLSQGMADYLAQTTGVKTQTEDAVGLADQLGRAVNSGKLDRLTKRFGLGPKDIADWKKLHTAMERVDFLNTRMERKSAGKLRRLRKPTRAS